MVGGNINIQVTLKHVFCHPNISNCLGKTTFVFNVHTNFMSVTLQVSTDTVHFGNNGEIFPLRWSSQELMGPSLPGILGTIPQPL